MKKYLLSASIMLLSSALIADTWTDPETGIEWTYSLNENKATLGAGYSASTVPKDTKGRLIIPSSVDGNAVVSVGSFAFSGCESLTDVEIPSSVREICNNAFYMCRAITNLVINEGVASISDFAFNQCSSLSHLAIPSTVTNIGVRLHGFCTSLQRYDVAEASQKYCSIDGVLLSKDGTTLVSCPALKCGDYAIPSTVTEIAGLAFFFCSSLTSITLPAGVNKIGKQAFFCCEDVLRYSVADGNDSFSSVDGVLFNKTMTEIVSFPDEKGGRYEIPCGVISVGSSAFDHCWELTEVRFPSSLREIQDNAFFSCSHLTSLNIPYGVTNIAESAFSCCSGLKDISVPSSVKSLGQSAFSSCQGLVTLTFPSGIDNVGTGVFSWCTNLTSVTVPRGVNHVGQNAFLGCSSLTSVDFECEPPSDLKNSRISKDAAIRYNVEYEDEWLAAIAACGFTNAMPYMPERRPVAFVAVNGVVSIESQIYTNSIYGTLPEASRDGCTFAGWYTEIDGTNRVTAFSTVDPGVTTLYARWVEEESALYAQWNANKYTVTFEANGGDGVMNQQPFLYDQEQLLMSNSFTKIGYTFKGWSSSATGDVLYIDQSMVSNLTAEAGFAVALFARWDKVIDVEKSAIENWVNNDLAKKFKSQGETESSYCDRFAAKYGSDYEVAFFKETGKIGMDGSRLCVWHDYVAGTDPLNVKSRFTASLTIVDGTPVVSYSPELADDEKILRVYKTWGKKELKESDWIEVLPGKTSAYKFFKVTVEMR